MALAILLVATLGLAVARVATGCGGTQLDYVDDGGLYHSADGAVPFVYGADCIGFDASTQSQPAPMCWPGATDSGCAAWAAGMTLPSYAGTNWDCLATELNQPGHCELAPELYMHNQACPEVGPAGEAFCSEWASQFVTHGRPIVHCVPLRSPDDVDAWLGLVCWPGTDCPPSQLNVETDAGTQCEYPCAP